MKKWSVQRYAEWLKEQVKICKESVSVYQRERAEAYQNAFGVLEAFTVTDQPAAPTIDTERHARWEAVNEHCNHAAVFRCSGRDGCGASVDYGHYTRFCDYEWCPNCGARMDAEGGRMDKVRCPYCGAIMTLLCVDAYSDGTITGAYYECIDCKSNSPYIEDAGDAEDIKEATRAAAMQRWVEPLKPLTLHEVTGSDEPMGGGEG